MFKNIIDSYNSKEYKSIVRDVFYVVNNLKEKYRIYSKYLNKKQNIDIMKHMIQNQIKLMYPIVPHISTYIADKMNINLNINMNIDNSFNYDIEIIDRFNLNEKNIENIREKFERFKKKGKIHKKCQLINLDMNEYEKIILKNQIKLDFEFINDSDEKFKIIFF